MSDYVICMENLGKMYKLYGNKKAALLDSFRIRPLPEHKKKYKDFWALRNVSLTIKRGERVALIGRNGAGKSTLLKVICGTIKPTEGTISINGKIQALMQLGIGFHPEYTGRQNIRASLAYHNLTKKEIDAKEDGIIEFSELGEFIDQPVKTYSQGMLARLGFSTSTAIDPEILIIDEVLGAGDAYFTTKCVERMRELTSSDGVTVIFVSHDLASVQYLCDRAVLIQNGHVISDGATLPVIKEYNALVRKDEEERLRIKDYNRAAHGNALLDRSSDMYRSLAFSITATNKTEPVKIRKIAMLADGECLREIAVGEPMDNNPKQPLFISDDSSGAWGKIEKDGHGYYRTINGASKKAAANFYANIPLHQEGSKLELKLDGEGNPDGYSISVTEESGLFSIENSAVSFKDTILISRAAGDEDVLNPLDYDHEEGYIVKKISLKDKDGVERKSFPFDKQLYKLEIECASEKIPIEQCSACMFINMENGTLLLADVRHYEFDKPLKKVCFEYTFKNVYLGANVYNISFAVYDKLKPLDRSFQKYLIRLDRTASFKIEERTDYYLSTPLVYAPVEASVITEAGACAAKNIYLANRTD